MTAPASTARVAPVGVNLGDGFATQIAFAADPNLSIWEKSVAVPGVDGGDAIETSTMHNTTWRTLRPRVLLTMTPFSLTVAYDPFAYDQIIILINNDDAITAHFPDGDSLSFYGFMKSFIPSALEEGSQPEATVEIVPTNVDPGTGSEEAPVLSATTGT